MRRFQTTLLSAFVIAILYTPVAFAQATAARVDVISGNGQMICPACAQKKFTLFYPMVVKVTDANGNPIANKTVNWQLVSGTSAPTFDMATTTDANGISISRLFQGSTVGGNALTPYLQSVINAYADSASTNFTETVALTSSAFGNQLVFTQKIRADRHAAVRTCRRHGHRSHQDPRGWRRTGRAGRFGAHSESRSEDPALRQLRNLSGRRSRQRAFRCQRRCDLLSGVRSDRRQQPGRLCWWVVSIPRSSIRRSVPQPLPEPLAFDQYVGIQLAVSAVTPGRLVVVSGNSQNINPGQTSSPLVVQVTDSTGAVNIANTAVAWTVSPAGAATLEPDFHHHGFHGQDADHRHLLSLRSRTGDREGCPHG